MYKGKIQRKSLGTFYLMQKARTVALIPKRTKGI